MGFCHRPMRAKDVREAVKATAAHPFLAARYGSRLADLERVWLGLLRLDASVCFILEETRGANLRIAGVGIATFVLDEFVRELKTPPLRWIGPEAVDRIVQGRSPVLSDREVREANSTTGLNVAVWQSAMRVEEFTAELANEATTSFHESLGGFLMRETVTQADCFDTWAVLRNMCQHLGLRFVNAVNGSYGEYPEDWDMTQPHLLGITRNWRSTRPAHGRALFSSIGRRE